MRYHNVLNRNCRIFMNLVCLLASLSAAASVVLLLTARGLPGLGWGNARFFAMSASTGFVATAIGAGALWSWHGRFMLLGLIGCWLGDYLGPHDFVHGLYAFLFGHFAFIAAYALLGIDWRRVAAACLPMLVLGCGIALWLIPRVPREDLLPVGFYMTGISVMVAVAAGIRPPSSRWIILAGAAVFYISDIFVARWKYVNPDPINAMFCYPMYYSACLTLALSLLAYAPGKDKDIASAEATPGRQACLPNDASEKTWAEKR